MQQINHFYSSDVLASYVVQKLSSVILKTDNSRETVSSVLSQFDLPDCEDDFFRPHVNTAPRLYLDRRSTRVTLMETGNKQLGTGDHKSYSIIEEPVEKEENLSIYLYGRRE